MSEGHQWGDSVKSPAARAVDPSEQAGHPNQATIESEVEVQYALRDVLAWARARAVTYRESDPIIGRASAMIATHVEDALRILLLPVP